MFDKNPNIPVESNNTIWAISDHDFYAEIPLLAVYEFLLGRLDRTTAVNTLDSCFARPKRETSDDKVLFRNFITFNRRTNDLNVCEFVYNKHDPREPLEFQPDTTSNIFKILDSEHARMVIYLSAEDNNDFIDIVTRTFGLKDHVFHPLRLHPGLIVRSYHQNVRRRISANQPHCDPDMVTGFALDRIVKKLSYKGGQ